MKTIIDFRKQNIPGMPMAPYFIRLSNGGIKLGTNQGYLPSIKELKKMKDLLTKQIRLGEKSIDEYNKSIDDFWEKEAIRYRTIIRNLRNEKPEEGFIYIVKSGIFYKIGRAKNKNRIKKYVTENPDEIRLCLWCESKDYKNDERALHEKYSEFCHRGEWFALKPIHLKEIKKFLTSKNI